MKLMEELMEAGEQLGYELAQAKAMLFERDKTIAKLQAQRLTDEELEYAAQACENATDRWKYATAYWLKLAAKLRAMKGTP